MGITNRFIEEPGVDSVLAWFRALPERPEELPADCYTVLYFRSCGPLIHGEEGHIDPRRSPVVTLFAPRVRRGVLWTVGEAHFLPTQLRRSFPALHRTAADLAKWLSSFGAVFRSGEACEFAYYLEGSVRNGDSPIYALPSGLEALKSGRYFVADGESDGCVDSLCRQLRLRGVECAVMRVAAHEPHTWFLLEEAGRYYFDARVTRSAVDWSVLVQLTESECREFHTIGRLYLQELAARIHNSPEEYLSRDLTKELGVEVSRAIQDWRTGNGEGSSHGHVRLQDI